MERALLPNPPLSRRRLLRLSRVPLPELVAGDVVAAAAGLLGCDLLRTLPDGTLLRARLVETEAYHMREPGSHAYRGMTPRNSVLFGRPGTAYVYFTYGMWHCANVVCEPEGIAAGVLLRAAVQLPSSSTLRMSGPGLLCQALQLTRADSGLDLFDPASSLRLERPPDWRLPPVEWTTRIGFSFPDIYPWRAVWQGHPGISPGRPGVIVGKQRK